MIPVNFMLCVRDDDNNNNKDYNDNNTEMKL